MTGWKDEEYWRLIQEQEQAEEEARCKAKMEFGQFLRGQANKEKKEDK